MRFISEMKDPLMKKKFQRLLLFSKSGYAKKEKNRENYWKKLM